MYWIQPALLDRVFQAGGVFGRRGLVVEQEGIVEPFDVDPAVLPARRRGRAQVSMASFHRPL